MRTISVNETCIIAVPHRGRPEVWFFNQPEKIKNAVIAHAVGDTENDEGLHDLHTFYVLPEDVSHLRRNVRDKCHGYITLSANVTGL